MPGRPAVLPLLLVLFFSACDDPTGVGSELVDDQGGRPVDVTLAPTDMASTGDADVTGGSAATQRILVGVTDDPSLGRIRATGHVDFARPPLGLSSAFEGNPVTAAHVVLIRPYVYGETASSLEVRLNDLQDEWSAVGRLADTTLVPGDLAAEYTFPVAGSVVEIPLSADWIARWSTALKDEDFGTLFHGVRIEAISGNAVVGFAQTGSYLRAVAGGDTTIYPASRTLTSAEFEEPLSLSSGQVLLQDTRSAGTLVRFDVHDEAVSNGAISRVRIEVPYDSTLTSNAPEGYVRPGIGTVELYAVAVDPPVRVSIAVAVPDDGLVRFEAVELLNLVRQTVGGDWPLDHFELSADPDRTSLDVLLLGRPVIEGPGANAIFTVVPLE